MKILIIEDEENITKYAKLLLEKQGHQVEVTDNAREAISLFSRFIPDIVIVDLYLNDEFLGLEVIAEISKLSGTVKIIVNSREPRERVEDRLKNYPVFAYMEKPVSIEDLTSKIEEAQKDK